MSFPAVLYDRVPEEAGRWDGAGDAPKEISREYCVVSSIVCNSSAPPEEEDDDDDDGWIHAGNGTSTHSSDFETSGADNRANNNNNNNGGDKEIDIDEDDDRAMQTIFEDPALDYVFVPVASPTIGGRDHEETNTGIRSGTAAASTARSKLVGCGRAFFEATARSARRWSDRLSSECRGRLHTDLRTRFEFCPSDLLLSSSLIYGSFDWVSDTIVDGSGTRLILPGPCVSLDNFDGEPSSSSSPSAPGGVAAVAAAAAAAANHRDGAGMPIVPGNTDSRNHHHAGSSFLGVPSAASSQQSHSSTMWGSSTIMVSAHDLLAIKRDRQAADPDGAAVPRFSSWFDDAMKEGEHGKSSQQQQQQEQQLWRWRFRNNNSDDDDDDGDDDEYNMVATTRSVARQITHALCKLAERKTSVWYRVCRNYLRPPLQNAEQRLVKHAQRLAVRYLVAAREPSSRLALLLSSSNASATTENDAAVGIESTYEKEGVELEIFCSNSKSIAPSTRQPSLRPPGDENENESGPGTIGETVCAAVIPIAPPTQQPSLRLPETEPGPETVCETLCSEVMPIAPPTQREERSVRPLADENESRTERTMHDSLCSGVVPIAPPTQPLSSLRALGGGEKTQSSSGAIHENNHNSGSSPGCNARNETTSENELPVEGAWKYSETRSDRCVQLY